MRSGLAACSPSVEAQISPSGLKFYSLQGTSLTMTSMKVKSISVPVEKRSFTTRCLSTISNAVGALSSRNSWDLKFEAAPAAACYMNVVWRKRDSAVLLLSDHPSTVNKCSLVGGVSPPFLLPVAFHNFMYLWGLVSLTSESAQS